MKTLLIALMMFFAVGLNGQNTIVNNTQWNLDRYINDCLKELKIDSITVVVVPCNDLIKGKYQGLMIQNNINMYSVMVYHHMDYNDACLIISHELVHVKQMMTGSLKTNENGVINFKNKNYISKKEDILDPYEVEAHKLGLQLYANNKHVIYSAPAIKDGYAIVY